MRPTPTEEPKMLREVAAVYRKEMRAYFVSPVPYFVMALFAGYMAYKFFYKDETAFFIYDRAEMYRQIWGGDRDLDDFAGELDGRVPPGSDFN